MMLWHDARELPGKHGGLAMGWQIANCIPGPHCVRNVASFAELLCKEEVVYIRLVYVQAGVVQQVDEMLQVRQHPTMSNTCSYVQRCPNPPPTDLTTTQPHPAPTGTCATHRWPTGTLCCPPVLCAAHRYSVPPTGTLCRPPVLCATHRYSVPPTGTLCRPPVLCATLRCSVPPTGTLCRPPVAHRYSVPPTGGPPVAHRYSTKGH